jgi:hypothetical protein
LRAEPVAQCAIYWQTSAPDWQTSAPDLFKVPLAERVSSK